MQTFNDSQGREWQLSVNVQSLHDVKEATGVLLTAMFDKGCALLQDLCEDSLKTGPVLWTLIHEQAESQGVTGRQFLTALEGDAVREAVLALARATADFFPNQEAREGSRALIDKILEVDKSLRTMTHTQMMAEMKAADSESLAKSCMRSALNSPESSASIPGNTRSDN